MMKAKKYDWKDSNMALFGSDTEKGVKKESAATEPAWNGAGQEVGVQIWRVVKFKITHWPKEDYGKFYNGDSYIILNTYKDSDSDELLYDVHFWIGQYSSQDEYGTAAYKTVELDTFMDDKPVQHREVMNHESDLFKTYFESLTLLKGGADTGFRRVRPEEYKTRLFKVTGTRKYVEVKQIPLKRSNINSDDVFILDKGLEIFVYTGESCNKDEKFKATQYVSSMRSERGGKPRVETLDGGESDDQRSFFEHFPEESEEDDDDDDDDDGSPSPQRLLKLSDADGSLDLDLVKEGEPLLKSDLDSNDAFVIDSGKDVFVWFGSKASSEETRNGLTYGHNYLLKQPSPYRPLTVVREGQMSAALIAVLG